MKNKLLCAVCVIAVTAFLINSSPSAIIAKAEDDSDIKYHLDIGFNQGWNVEASKWHHLWGVTIEVASELDFGREVEIVGYYPLNEVEFLWNDPAYSFNACDYLKNGYDFDRYYGRYTSNKIRTISATSDKNIVLIRYDVRLESPLPFDLSYFLRNGKENWGSYLYGLLGGEESLKKYEPEIYQMFEQAFKNGLADGIDAFMVFSPTIIAYREKNTEPPPQQPPAPPTTGTPGTSGNTVPPGTPTQVTPPPNSTGCGETITWSETVEHVVVRGLSTIVCQHVYTYESKLTSTATLSPSTLKSGYGFEVNLVNTITRTQISNSGICGTSKTRTSTKIPKPPDSAKLSVSWTVDNATKKTTQGKTIALEKKSEEALKTVFYCAKNSVSMSNERKIYTNVAIAGTNKAPVKHDVVISISGGGIDSASFCKTLTSQITINGNMYEDDVTTNRKP